MGRLRANRRRLRDSGACRIAPATVPLARSVRHSSTPVHSPARRPRALFGHDVMRDVHVWRRATTWRWPNECGRPITVGSARRRNGFRRVDSMNTIGQRVLVQRATGQREPVAFVSVSHASRILHLPLSERLCARDLGEVDRGMKANHEQLNDRWKPRVSYASCAFVPMAGGGTFLSQSFGRFSSKTVLTSWRRQRSPR